MADIAHRDLSVREVAEYQKEGVVLARQGVDAKWIDRMLEVIDKQLANPSEWVQDTNPGGKESRFLHDRYLWPTDPDFRDFVFNSGVGELAARAMKSSRARIYFDHIFVKEPNTQEEFFWHQDLPYWPFKGEQICSVWLALTDADVESSTLEFVRGSHEWGKWFRPVIPGGEDEKLDEWIGSSYEEEIPDFNVLRDDYEFLSFDVKAGDAIIFNTAIVHASHGNKSPNRRRVALSTRWLGDDAVWDPRPGTDPIVTQDDVSIESGSPANDDWAFPIAWPLALRPPNAE